MFNLNNNLRKSNRDFMKPLSITEQKRFTNLLIKTNIIKEPYKTAFLTQLYMGLRNNEITNIKNSDINFDYNVINVNSKFMFSNRVLEIPKFLRPYLINQFENSKQNVQNTLFYNYKLPQSVFILKKTFKNKLSIDRKVSPHLLRATYIQRYIENNKNICNIEKLIGTKRLPNQGNYDNFENMNIDELLKYYEKNIQKNEYNKQLILAKTKKINKEIFSNDKNKLVIPGNFNDFNYGKTILLKDRYITNIKNEFDVLEETKAFLQGISLLNNYIKIRDKEKER